MRRNPWWVHGSNIALSLLVLLVFLYLLVLAIAQDQVLAKLSRSAEFSNYSSSLLDARKAKDAAELVDTLAGKRQQLRAEVAVLETQAAVAELDYQREAMRLAPMLDKIDGTGDCRITRKPNLTVPGLTPQEKEMQAKRIELASAQQCFDLDAQLGEGGRATYLSILASAQRLSDVAVRVDIARKLKTQQSQALQNEINRQVADLKKIAPSRIHFTALDSLEPDWFPINFVNLPPFVIRILLIFSSGAFGALLITMVFIVFPRKLRERVAAKLYYKRVFLGGIVALTVFIVLTGGAAILGTSDVSTDEANVMSFTAIGLLAGMFSDSVADWLKARAEKMFSTGDEDDNDDDDKDGKVHPTGGEPVPSA